ncbi:uncharacterized protein TM35_000491220 [Trypanosoma theileri]|uniref:Uncharacterized protein n=1 Tax=Trypanosoma theileri TaxID=67003 RepID=A0A1X0NHG1_9TRYP|nr:uncharacterized protein TM35_000491220 [Trypanosoma theileri]ORC84116.1 hypothetical protein TM35_000491220 [Trypanosoma theileri]
MTMMMNSQQEEQQYRIMRLNRKPAVGPSHHSIPYNDTASSPTPTYLNNNNNNDNNNNSSAHTTPTLQYCTSRVGFVNSRETPHTGRAVFKGIRATTVHIERGSARVQDEPFLLFAGRRPAPSGVSTAMQQHVHLFHDPVKSNATTITRTTTTITTTTTTTTTTRRGERETSSIFTSPSKSEVLGMNSRRTPNNSGSVNYCREARLAMLRGNGPLW